MTKELEALEDIILYLNASEPKGLYCENIETIQQALQRLEAIENTFADSHICEIQKEFAKYDKLCEETKCEECALGVGDGICLRKTFERNWELQKEVVFPNSVNLLMQELDCKDFAELRKYARCGYEKLNKKYLKWEDLEFEDFTKEIEARIGDNICKLEYRVSMLGNKTVILMCNNKIYLQLFENEKQFFNDLHLEVIV